MIDQGAQALIISPLNSEGLDPALEYAQQKNVPIMTIDRFLTTKTACKDYIGWVGSDFVEQGKRAADAMSRARPATRASSPSCSAPPASTSPTTATRASRTRWPRRPPRSKVVAKQAADYERAKGQTVTEQLIQANPEINCIYAHNDEMALGAVAALKAAGKQPGDVKILTIDGTKGAVQGIVDGWISGVIESNPRFGPLAFKALADFYGGSRRPGEDHHLRQGVHQGQRRGELPNAY